METVNLTNSVRTETVKGKITVDKIYKSDFQKEGTLTAQIRQEIETKSFYPSKKVDSNLQSNIFDAKDFGFTEQEFVSKETRMAWILVPSDSKEADVQAKLDEHYKNGACIYKVLSVAPILDNNQKHSIAQGQRTEDDFANVQAVRYPKGNDREGQLILDANGNVQYKRTFFWKEAQSDLDVRSQETPYISAKLKAELEGASILEGQTI